MNDQSIYFFNNIIQLIAAHITNARALNYAAPAKAFKRWSKEVFLKF